MIRLPKSWEANPWEMMQAQRAESAEPRTLVDVNRRGFSYRVAFFRDGPESVHVACKVQPPARPRTRRIWHESQGAPGPIPAEVIGLARKLHPVANRGLHPPA